MNKVKVLTMAAIAAATVFVSCNSNDEVNNSNDRVAVKFSSSINVPQTRLAGGGNQWAAGDEIGIFMVQSGAALESNKKYAAGNGNISSTTFSPSPASTETIFYPVNAPLNVGFVACYPWKSGTVFGNNSWNIADQSAAAKYAAADLMYASTGETYSKTSAGVTLPFAHKFSKLVLTIVQPGTSANATGLVNSDLTGMTVKVKGMKADGTVNFASYSLTLGSAAADITPCTITDGARYEAILLPQAATGVTVEFTVSSSETFTWTIPSTTTFASENEYTYDVTLTRNGVSVTGTITPWSTNSGTGTAN